MSNIVTKIMSLQLPPAETIVPADRPDLSTAIELQTAPADRIATLKTRMQSEAESVAIRSHAAADIWISNAFTALQKVVNSVPTANRSTTLFIASTPEFGLNGWKNGEVLNWNATGVIPDRLRTYIAGRVDDRLADIGAGLNILFSFSCCAYPDIPIDTVEGLSKIGMNNQITIRALSGGTIITGRTIRKRIPTSADGMPYSFGLITAWASGASGAEQTRPSTGGKVVRDMEVVYNSPWRTPKQPINIGFATCQDVAYDSHPNCNFVVVSGAVATWFRYDFDSSGNFKPFLLTQPFIVNDYYSWDTSPKKEHPNPAKKIKDLYTNAQLYAPGYYQRNAKAPEEWGPSVATKVKDMPVTQNRLTPDGRDTLAAEMTTTYNFPPSTPNNYVLEPPPPFIFISSTVAQPNPPFAASVAATDIPSY